MTTNQKPALSKRTPATPPDSGLTPARAKEFQELTAETVAGVRRIVHLALRIGLRIGALANECGTVRDAIRQTAHFGIPENTSYRWYNAACAALLAAQGETDMELLSIPSWDPKSKAWHQAEDIMEQTAKRSTLRRLILGGGGNKADAEMTRIDNLIDMAESGDPHAEEILRKMDEGLLSPVQAIRAAAGAAATKGKRRNDPVYLTIDGRTGKARGLFCKSLVTISNTFGRWEHLEEPARRAAREVWLELVSNLPPELR